MTAVAGGIVHAADITDLIALTTARPLVRLVANSTQSLADATAVAITFATEDIDTHGFHSTSVNTSRITPTIAGYYRVRGTVLFGARADYADLNCWIRLNGSSNLAPAYRGGFAGITTSSVETGIAEVIVSLNGTTDYVELVAQQNNTANVAQVTNQSSQFSSGLELEFLRSL